MEHRQTLEKTEILGYRSADFSTFSEVVDKNNFFMLS